MLPRVINPPDHVDGAALQVARKLKGWSLAQLAKASRVRLQAIKDLEGDRRRVTAEELGRILRALGREHEK